jgi:hypothetical protein
MAQRGCGFGFPLKAAKRLCVVGEFIGKELQGDVATELEVFRLVHHTHAPAADLAQDAVWETVCPTDWKGVDTG